MEIFPGIHQIKVPIPNNPLGVLNVYLIRGGEGWLMVDTGWNCDEAFRAVEQGLGDVGLGLVDIRRIVITHVHPDHYGLMGRLARACGAKTAFHKRACDVIEAIVHSREVRVVKVAEQLRENGAPETEVAMVGGGFAAVRSTLRDLDLPDEILHGGETVSTGLFSFEVINTPGHAPGHICLYEHDKKILISGDHVLPRITPSISMVPYFDDNPLGMYLDSLREINKLDVSMVLPGHEQVFEDFHGRIKDIIAHHEDRLADALKAVHSKGKTAYQTAAEMPWTVDAQSGAEASFADLDAVGRGMATGETIAHLEYLVTQGKAERKLRKGLVLYRAC